MKTQETAIKELIIESLMLEDMTPDDIENDIPLFDGGLGLDSIDALELGVALKKRFGVSVREESEEDMQRHFYSVDTLAAFIQQRSAED